jgi:hypothetical protein
MNPKTSVSSSYDGMGFRGPKKRKGAIYAANIGLRAPKETRQRLEWLVRCLSYSANRVVVEAIDAIYNQIRLGPTHTPEVVLRGRDLSKYVQ